MHRLPEFLVLAFDTMVTGVNCAFHLPFVNCVDAIDCGVLGRVLLWSDTPFMGLSCVHWVLVMRLKKVSCELLDMLWICLKFLY